MKDKANGEGKCHYDNGDAYEGTMKNNRRHGRGKYTWTDGSLHIGVWKDGGPVINLRF